MSRVRAFLRWAKWEFDRDIEVTPFIRFITFERLIKGGLLVVAGVVLFASGEQTGVHDLAVRYQTELNLQPGSSWWRDVSEKLLRRLATLNASTQQLLAIGAVLYGALEVFEGVGLIMRKRWAEYVVVVATAAFIPLEVVEALKHVTILKALGLLLNVAIVVYLIWRKRLFIERPSEEPPDTMREDEQWI